MMTESEIRTCKARWETAAKDAAASRNRLVWDHYCDLIWALEFILDEQVPGAPAPSERIPFEVLA